jgi:redox-sensitive bicupin YhaK (pirin superfamily)
MAVRRNEERQHLKRRAHDAWLTFGLGTRSRRYSRGFGALLGFDEARLPPGAAAQVARNTVYDVEVVTYVLEGSVSARDSRGRQRSLDAGEFQRRHAARSDRTGYRNASPGDWAHTFQIALRRPRADVDREVEQKRFAGGDRRNGLCMVASPDGRGGSLQLRSDALIYSAMLQLGQHVVHELPPGRGAWLHIVQGEARVGNVVLKTGDGLGIANERALSLTATDATELLLVELGRRSPRAGQDSVHTCAPAVEHGALANQSEVE